MNTQQNVNNKQTMEELRQEVFQKTEAEFEKKRRKLTRSLWYRIPFVIVIGIVFITIVTFLWYLVLFVHSTEAREPIVFVGVCMVSLSACLTLMPVINFFEEYTVSQKIKNLKQTLKEKYLKKDELSIKLQESKANYEKQNSFANWLQDPNITIITPNPIWPSYIMGIAKQAEEHIQQVQQEYDVLDEEIVRLEAELQFYNQVQERNFWQYLKSRKWLKKK